MGGTPEPFNQLLGDIRMLFRIEFWLVLSTAFLSGCGSWGSGQEEASPNGRLNASALFYYDGGREWLVYEVVDAATGATVWDLDNGTRKKVDPPFDQGFGNYDYIQWAADSKELRLAHECVNTTDVVKWLSITFDASGHVIAGPTPVAHGFKHEDRRQRSP